MHDAAQVCEIYNHYVYTSHATFELEALNEAEMNERIVDLLSSGFPYLVAEENGEVIGYAYGHQFRPRRAYQQTVEVSVYVKYGCEGRGIASRLYEELIPQILNAGYHAVVAVIALPNDVSVRLHEKYGFEKAGHFREVGRKFDRWIDVGYWQLQNDATTSRN
jgi:phosphinothricin acetyltransferase